MSTPPDVVQGLLQSLSPWMTGSSPSGLNNTFAQYGGTQGLLSALMQGAGQDTPQARMGAAMQAAQTQALQRAAARQQLAQQSIGLQQNMAMFPMLLNAMSAYTGQQPGTQGGSTRSTGTSDKSPSADTSGSSSATGSAPQAAPASGGATGQAPPLQAPADASGAPSLSSGLNLASMLSLMNRPGADTFLKSIQASPSYLTQSKAAQDPLTVDQTLMTQAAQAGNRPALTAAYLKYLKDAGQVNVDRNGNVITMGGVTPGQLGVNAFLPAQGVQTSGGVASPIPGILGARQALAGAQAQGEAQGDVEKVTDSNGNEYFVPRAALLGSGNPAANSTTPASVAPGSALTQGSTPFVPATGSAQPGSRPAQNQTSAAGSLPMAALGQSQEELLKSKGEQASDVNKVMQEKADAGQQMLAQLAELQDSARDFTPGQFADTRMKMLKLMQASGLITPEQEKSLGSAQAAQKIAIQLQAAATKQLGTREAAQVFSIMGKSMPNLTLSPDGLNKISAYMGGIARYDIARAQIAQQRMASNDVNGLNAVRDDFIKNTNPLYFIVASADPATQAEMVSSMGSKGAAFLNQWRAAAKAGWAPAPGEYNGQP